MLLRLRSTKKIIEAEVELNEDVEAVTTKRGRTLKLAQWDDLACRAGLCRAEVGSTLGGHVHKVPLGL